MADYNEEFYQYQMQGSLRSAEVIVPMVLDIVNAQSVIDIGCGVGTWLSVYKKQGVGEIQGLDGDYVDRDLLLIDKNHFSACDLSKPLNMGRSYDLVQSLEVAEHIDRENAKQFVSNLTRLGNTILFSAAVPYQLGTGHINEQYIDYWVELFDEHNYVPIDAIRPGVWTNELVEVCYRQNILLFVETASLADRPKLADARKRTRDHQLNIIHPELYQPRIMRLLNTLVEIAGTVKTNGNFPLAKTILNSIVDFDPRNNTAWDILGQVAAQTGDSNAAISHIKKAIDINASEAGHHFNLGQVYSSTGRKDKALEQFRLALSLRPDDNNIQKAIDLLESTLAE